MLLCLLSLVLADAPKPATLQRGVRESSLDIWRPWKDADKIYVMVGLPDGSEELFLVDTGASVSVLNTDVAKRLGIQGRDTGEFLQGLGGAAPWIQATLPTIKLGDFTLTGVDVAVGVPGVPDLAGVLPIAGILGNNIWSNFTMVVDYPADLLELYKKNAYKVPRKAHPMSYDGYQPATTMVVRAEKDGKVEEAEVLLEIDTGAHDLLFAGVTGEPFRPVSSVGVEPVLGVGADLDSLPEADFLQLTRHIPVTTLRLGPHDVDFEQEARWLGADGATSRPTNMRGLIGYEVFKNHRLVLDYPGQRLVLEDSKVHPARDFDAVAAYLQRELELHGQAPERALVRARLQIGSDDISGARKSVEEALQKLPDNVELRVMLARIQRYEGQIEEAITTLRDLDPKQVSDEGEWLAFINALVLSGHTEEALRRAEAALNLPEIQDYQGEFLVAVSDALLANGKLAQAAAAIDEATRISGGRNGHLLRKARIAYAEQDRYGTIVVLRRLMDIYPLNGVPMWLYALMSQPRDQETFAVDLETALARLHPGDQPWDFAGAAWQIIGQKEKAKAALDAGYARDCEDLDGSERANCDAWYWSLGEQRPEEAQARIQEALKDQPTNSAFEDTATVVALAAKKPAEALAHARRAAVLSPDDPYLLWQLSRLEATYPKEK